MFFVQLHLESEQCQCVKLVLETANAVLSLLPDRTPLLRLCWQSIM
jgi:hypothetical protein